MYDLWGVSVFHKTYIIYIVNEEIENGQMESEEIQLAVWWT